MAKIVDREKILINSSVLFKVAQVVFAFGMDNA